MGLTVMLMLVHRGSGMEAVINKSHANFFFFFLLFRVDERIHYSAH